MFGLRIGAMGRVGSGLTLTQAAANVRAAYSTSPQVWYDPSDLSTLYQDSAGTTPVTAVGQPVGLMLDKSRGLVLGSELVSNGGFDSDTVWTKGTGWTIGSGVATKTAGTASALTQTIASTATRWYRVTATITRTAGTLTVSLGTSGQTATFSASSTATFFVLAGSSTQTLSFSGDAAFAGTVDAISVRELPGLHASQPTALARPVLQQENGLMFLLCDGTDDGMVTPSWDLTSTDKVTVVAGVRKLSDVNSVIAELSAAVASNAGTFGINTASGSGAALDRLSFRSRGSGSSAAGETPLVTAPATFVFAGAAKISGPTAQARLNGVAGAVSTTNQGTGTYGNYPLYLFRRGGTTLPFNGRFYGLTIIGAQLSASDITVLEKFTAAKTGVTVV